MTEAGTGFRDTLGELRVGGVRLSYRDAGDGPVVLLLHGLGASRDDWYAVVPRLATRYRVIAPDLRGHGDSQRPTRGYRPEVLARDVLALIESLGLREYVVVGHSMGGAVALTLALSRPPGLRGLVVANSVPGFRPRRLRECVEIAMRLGTMALLGPAALGKVMAQRLYPDDDQIELRERTIHRAARNSRRVYLASLAGLTRWQAFDRLAEVAVPTMIVGSGQDYFQVADVEAYAHGIPGGEFLLLPDGRHGLPLEEPEALSEALEDFLVRRVWPLPDAQVREPEARLSAG